MAGYCKMTLPLDSVGFQAGWNPVVALKFFL